MNPAVEEARIAAMEACLREVVKREVQMSQNGWGIYYWFCSYCCYTQPGSCDKREVMRTPVKHSANCLIVRIQAALAEEF